jgi:hypothetical protein
MELTAIRTGRKITAYEYRGVSITRNDSEGGTLWEWTLIRAYRGPDVIQVRTKDEIITHIDKTLDSKGRDWYAKPVIYIAHNGKLVDARLLGAE